MDLQHIVMEKLLLWLFTRKRKKKERKPKKMSWEANAMLDVLLRSENERVPKYLFYQAWVHNPWRAKSTLVNKRGKLIICKKEWRWVHYKASWMLISNGFEARRNMSEKEKKLYPIERMYKILNK